MTEATRIFILRKFRKTIGMNQSEFAEALGLKHQSQVSRLEAGVYPLSNALWAHIMGYMVERGYESMLDDQNVGALSRAEIRDLVSSSADELDRSAMRLRTALVPMLNRCIQAGVSMDELLMAIIDKKEGGSGD